MYTNLNRWNYRMYRDIHSESWNKMLTNNKDSNIGIFEYIDWYTC